MTSRVDPPLSLAPTLVLLEPGLPPLCLSSLQGLGSPFSAPGAFTSSVQMRLPFHICHPCGWSVVPRPFHSGRVTYAHTAHQPYFSLQVKPGLTLGPGSSPSQPCTPLVLLSNHHRWHPVSFISAALRYLRTGSVPTRPHALTAPPPPLGTFSNIAVPLRLTLTR